MNHYVKSVLYAFVATVLVYVFLFGILPVWLPNEDTVYEPSLFTQEVLYADTASVTYSFVAHATAVASEVNQNFQDLMDVINGKLDSANVENNTLLDADIHTSGITSYSKVTDTAIGGATYWDVITNRDSSVDDADALHSHAGFTGTADFASITGTISAAQHGDLSGSAATMHSATSVTVEDAGGYYTSTHAEGILAEVGVELASQTTEIMSQDGRITALEGGGASGFTYIGSGEIVAGVATVVVPANTYTDYIQVNVHAILVSVAGLERCDVSITGVAVTPERYRIRTTGSGAVADPEDYYHASFHFFPSDGWNITIPATVTMVVSNASVCRFDVFAE